jgi:hypothetical protein
MLLSVLRTLAGHARNRRCSGVILRNAALLPDGVSFCLLTAGRSAISRKATFGIDVSFDIARYHIGARRCVARDAVVSWLEKRMIAMRSFNRRHASGARENETRSFVRAGLNIPGNPFFAS